MMQTVPHAIERHERQIDEVLESVHHLSTQIELMRQEQNQLKPALEHFQRDLVAVKAYIAEQKSITHYKTNFIKNAKTWLAMAAILLPLIAGVWSYYIYEKALYTPVPRVVK